MKFNKLVKTIILENINSNEFLWHGTSEPESNFKNGIMANHNGLVFLTDNPERAIEYGETDQDRTGNSDLLLIKVDVSKLSLDRLVPDPDHEQWDDETNTEITTWQHGLEVTDQCAYMGDIPEYAIEIENIN